MCHKMRNMAQEVYGSDFRENQKHFFEFFMQHPNKNIIAEAPTGSGKSLMAIHIAINMDAPGTVFIVTPTKDLMEQYKRDFGDLEEVMLLAGKNEYSCKDNEEFTAENCTHNPDKPCEYHYSSDKKNSCTYSRKISTFMDYKVVVTNYHMMLALIKIRSSIEWGCPLIIWDESHRFQDIIREMTGIEYNHKTASRIIREDLSKEIYEFFIFAKTPVNGLIKKLSDYKETFNTKDDAHKMRWIERLQTQMQYRSQYDYLKAEEYEILKDNREKCVRVIPVDYTSLSRSTYMEAAPQHLMMSGTIHFSHHSEQIRLDLIKKITGMDMDCIYETPQKYRFDDDKIIKKAPAVLSNIKYSNSRDFTDFKNVYGHLLRFLEKEKRNILIHFNARWQCQHMEKALKASDYGKPVYNFHNGENNTNSKQNIKQKFIETGGCIIGSSLHEGIDFPGKQVEVVVIGRAPFVPKSEENKFFPGTNRKIQNKVRKTWKGLIKQGVYDIEKEEYRLKTLQQIGRLQRTAEDTGLVILCNRWMIHPSVLEKFELCDDLK